MEVDINKNLDAKKQEQEALDKMKVEFERQVNSFVLTVGFKIGFNLKPEAQIKIGDNLKHYIYAEKDFVKAQQRYDIMEKYVFGIPEGSEINAGGLIKKCQDFLKLANAK